MRFISISILCLCLMVSCGRSSDNTLSLAFEKIRAFQESEDVKFLSEAHDLFRQCEDGKSARIMIPYRIVLYEVFADYDGARNYISKVEGSHRAEQFDPIALRTELELYENSDNNELNQVDSLLHLLIKRYAQLYRETNDDYWLQQMVGMYVECRGDSQELGREFFQDAFPDPKSFDMDRFLQLVDQSELSFEETYQEVLRVRNELNGFQADCLNPRLLHAILESIDEEKKMGDYHYPDSVLCAGVWFDLRGDVDSIYILCDPVPLYDEAYESLSPEKTFLGYYEGKNCLISIASIGKLDGQTVERFVDTADLSTDKDAYKTTSKEFTPDLDICARSVYSHSVEPDGTLFLRKVESTRTLPARGDLYPPPPPPPSNRNTNSSRL